MKMDEILDSIAEELKHLAVIHLVETTLAPDFNKMYELYDPICGLSCFPSATSTSGLGTGNNQINRAKEDKQETIELHGDCAPTEAPGKAGLVMSLKD